MSLVTTASILVGLGITAPSVSAANFLRVESDPGDWIGQGLTQTFTPANGSFTASRIYNSPKYFSLKNGVNINFLGKTPGLFGYWNLIFTASEDATLVPGIYEGATRWPFQSSTNPGLDIVAGNRGCNQLTGRFVVHEAVYGASGAVERFAADFEQHCEAGKPALVGQIRFNSSDEPPPVKSVPEPTMMLAFLSISGLMLTQRRRLKPMQ